MLRHDQVRSLIGSVVGWAAVCAAMDHNPQEEFVSHATGAINYAGLAEIFVSWFALVSLATGFILALVLWPLAD
jgi:phosphate/sulfate permease